MKRVRRFFRYDNVGLLYALPAFIYMLIFAGYPIFSNIVLSLQNVTVRNLARGTKEFIRFENYITLFGDAVFKKAVWNTFLNTASPNNVM